jgi:hypothetical protein
VVRRSVAKTTGSTLAESCHGSYFALADPTRQRRALQIPIASTSRRKTGNNLGISQASALLSLITSTTTKCSFSALCMALAT